jgi:Cadherin domain
VAAVTSTDVDGGAAQYGIAGGADASRFTIDAAAGTLSFRSAPDFEAPSDADRDNVYDLVISVADGNGGIDTQTIAVAVSGVNEAPRNIQPAAVELNEQAPAGTVVAIVTASDPDAGDLFTFTLVNDGAGRFVVDPASGRLQVAPGAIIDFETTPSLSLVLRVTDAQGLRTEQTIVVTLRDVAEAPPDMLPPDLTPPPAPSPAPAPTVPAITPVVANTIEEIVRGSGREPAAAVTPGPFGSMMDGEPERDSRWQAQRGRSAANGAPLLVASVSFGSDGTGLGGWSEGALDGLLQPQSEGLAQRFGLLTLRGSSIETEASDSPSRASGRDADEALLAALQDPVRVASATLTAGFVWWLTRSGGLLTSILMGIPAWRHVDLLPVLAPARDDEDDDGLGADSQDDDAKPDRQDSLIDEMFSNTSRMFGESRFLT